MYSTMNRESRRICHSFTTTRNVVLLQSIEEIIVEAYGLGLSDRVIRAIHANCRPALEKAVQEGLMRTNPAIGCKMPPKKSREMKVLTQNEVIRFLNRAKEEGYYELFLLELVMGMRRGEILTLKWGDSKFAPL